jgi:ribosomal-protein-alanine N-acetyltransferase
MNLDDTPVVARVDNASFEPVWQNSVASLNIAYHQSIISTVAEMDNKVVGYQISTPTSLGAHLARLAIDPQYQHRGIGYALLDDLLQQCERRGISTVTINTQEDNYASQALYHKAGFYVTGEQYPIYQTLNH